MTEQEAIWVLKDFDKQVTVKANGAYQSTVGEMACKVAITALEELQQYRAMGTVEECREAREKQKALNPVTYTGTNRADCPVCGATVRGIGKPFGNWCPLLPLPERITEPIDADDVGEDYSKGTMDGWNACIDAITGEREKK